MSASSRSAAPVISLSGLIGRVPLAAQVRVSALVEESIVDGPGLRYVVFTQGCPHHCPGCHNPETHDPEGGTVAEVDAVFEQFRENPLLSGITFSGGEPFMQPEPLCRLAEAVASLGKTVVTYTGFTFEQLTSMGRNNPAVAELLALTDTLIDGPYVDSLRDLELTFRGSANQRVLSRDDREQLLNVPLPG